MSKQQLKPIKLLSADAEVLSAAAKTCGLTLHSYIAELAMCKAAELRGIETGPGDQKLRVVA